MAENRWANEPSAYLRSAAHQPVQCNAWSAQEFVRAFSSPGINRVMLRVDQYYRASRDEASDAAAQRIRELAAREGSGRPGTHDESRLAAGIDSIRQAFDPTHEGFGYAPNFPHPS